MVPYGAVQMATCLAKGRLQVSIFDEISFPWNMLNSQVTNNGQK